MSNVEQTRQPNYGIHLRISRVFVAEPSRGHWAYAMAKRVGTTRGHAHEVLENFKSFGWVKPAREDRNPSGRPARVLYLITEKGFEAMRESLLPFQIGSTSVESTAA